MGVNVAEASSPSTATCRVTSGSVPVLPSPTKKATKQNAAPSPSYSNDKNTSTAAFSSSVALPSATNPSCVRPVASKSCVTVDRSPSAAACSLNVKKYIQDAAVTSEKAATPVSTLASAGPLESAPAATSILETPVLPSTARVAEAAETDAGLTSAGGSSGASSGRSAPSRNLQSVSNPVISRKPSGFASRPPCGKRETARVHSGEKGAPPCDRAARLSPPRPPRSQTHPPRGPPGEPPPASRPSPQRCDRAAACADVAEKAVQPRAQAASSLSPTGAPPPVLQPPQLPAAAVPSDACRDKEPPRDSAPRRPETARHEGAQTWADILVRLGQVNAQAMRTGPPAAPPQPPTTPSDHRSNTERWRHEPPHQAKAWTTTGERPVQRDAQAVYRSAATAPPAPPPPGHRPSRAPLDPRRNTDKPRGAAVVSPEAAALPSSGKFDNVKAWVDISPLYSAPEVGMSCSPPTYIYI